MRIENSILSGLVFNETYTRKVIPFISKDYFLLQPEKVVFTEISRFFEKYNKLPTIESLKIDISSRSDVTQSDFDEAIKIVDEISDYVPTDFDWLVDKTEALCKERAVYNALYEALYIAEGKDDKRAPESIPSILADALAVSFDSHIGHDYLDDALSRYEFYHKLEERIPFNLDIFNKITGNGLPKKTLSCVISGPGGGKSLFMCNYAASSLALGKNVLYISMEMSEERIAERIDANLLNVPIKDIPHMEWTTFDSKVKKIQEKTRGKLIIKEYPTGGAHAGHFRALLQDLKMKLSFIPDVIIIDYLNICSSQRVKNASANSYTIVKSIAEEIRGLAIEFDVPILTATQVNRSGSNDTDMGMSHTSDSFGLPQTLDLFFALIRTEELDALGQIMVKQLKNRYNDPSYYKKFCIGVDFSRMKLYDVEQSAQDGIVDKGKDDSPVFDRGFKSNTKTIVF